MSIEFRFDEWSSAGSMPAVERADGHRLSAIWHPLHPFSATVDATASPQDLGESLFTVFAARYLQALADAGFDLKLGDGAVGLTRPPVKLGPESRGSCPDLEPRWFAFDSESPRNTLPGSFQVRRKQPDSEPSVELDGTLILIAGMVRAPQSDGEHYFRLLDGRGLRLVVHYRRVGSSLRLQATGLVTSLPTVDAAYIARFSEPLRLIEKLPEPRSGLKVRSWPDSARLFESAFKASGLDDQRQVPVEYRVGLVPRGKGSGLGVVVRTRSKGNTREPGYRIDAEIDESGHMQLRRLSSLSAHGNDEILIFRQDPASQGGADHWQSCRPNRSSRELAKFRQPVGRGEVGLSSGTSPVALRHRFFHVCECTAAGDSGQDTKSLAMVPAGHDVRTNEFAAINAYVRGFELFEFFQDCQLSPDEYFRFAHPSVQLHYRGLLSYGAGKSGEVVNAEAQLQPLGNDPGDEPTGAGEISVHFALADLESSPGLSPLGIACDPRWAWHEFGHVLLAAATGELELPFVHSVGDSLAAILCDPDSRLAEHAGWRGQTYPWVLTRRRHDREAASGWSWGGELDRVERAYFSFPDRGRSQYWAEQILSTTLFRLYRALGGDTISGDAPDRASRRDAARYTAYLIVRAVRLLGPCSVVPAMTARQFMAALLDADAGTGLFRQTNTTRAGGAAIKAIQWAFHRQGLVVKASQEQADLSIDDTLGRLSDQPTGGGEGDRGPWVEVGNTRSECSVSGSARIVVLPADVGDPEQVDVWVRIENTGTATASAYTVHISTCVMGADGSDRVALWNSKAWERATPIKDFDPLDPGHCRWTGPFRCRLEEGTHAILAWVSSIDDRACLDPDTGLPCATFESDVRWLAALDDNVALGRFRKT